MKTRATRLFRPTPFRGAGLPVLALLLCLSLSPAFAASAASPNSSRSPTASPNSGVATSAAGTTDTVGSNSRATSSSTTANTNGSDVLKWSDRHFVNEVADGNQQEIVFAQLASQQATDPGVRTYAQRLISDHMAMGRDLMQLAQQKGVTLDSDVSNYSANATWNTTYDRTGSSNSPMISGSSPNDMNRYDSSSTPANNNNKTVANGGTPGRTMNGSATTNGSSSSPSSTSTDETSDRSRATAGMVANTPSSPSINSGTAAANNSSTSAEATAGSSMPAGMNGAGQYTGTPASMSGRSTSGPGLGWWGDRQYHRLAKESGTDFDRDFIDRMVDDHEKDVKMFEKKANDADDPDVRAFAAKQLPTLRQHLSQAQNLAQNEK
jgi:putative membrane protein